MPKYKVLKSGFHNGKLYDPEGRRPVLTLDKPLKPVPSWLEEIKQTAKPKTQTAKPKTQTKSDVDFTQNNNVETL